MKLTALKFRKPPADILKRMLQVTSFFDRRSFLLAFAVPSLLTLLSAGAIYVLAEDHSAPNGSGFPVEISGASIGSLDIKPQEETKIDAAPLTPDDTVAASDAGGDHGSTAHAPTPEVPALPVAQPTEKLDGLFEQTPFGDVPIIRASDKASIYSVYKMPFVPDVSAKGMISVVLMNYGLSERVSAAALSKAPKDVSFVVSPYAAGLQNKIDLARSAGHEVWLQAIIQGQNFGMDDTGPLTMLSGLNTTQNNIRLLQTLSLGHGYSGIVFENAPDFKDSPAGLQDIMAFLGAHGIALSSTVPSDMLSNMGGTMTVRYMPPNLLINADMDEGEVRAMFRKAADLATKNYYAVVYAYPTASTLSALKSWPDELKSSSIQLAPLSAVLDKFATTASKGAANDAAE